MQEVIKQYNPDFANTEKFDEETCFYMQLTYDEKDEYLDLKIQYLKSRINNLEDEISLNNFQRLRNHPNRELYRTDSMSMTPYDEYVELLEEELEVLFKKQRLLVESECA
tara:strand:- start:456 stop:785 length:330 start_codon:yes stop_codon:yes gene_type:complete